MKIFFVTLLLSLGANVQAQFDLLTYQEELPCVNKKFSVVIHSLLDSNGNPSISEEAMKTVFERVNEFWEPICVSFEVCDFRTVANYQFDTLIKKEELNRLEIENNVANRINVYHLRELEVKLRKVGGCASLGGINKLNDGSIVLVDVNSLAHEMGHYFGLPHTFEGDGNELVNGSNCETAGDGICDTPADPFVEGEDLASYVNDCRFISSKVDENGEYYRPDVGNIMSYYGCSCGFTYGQYLRMAQLAEASDMW